jgi:23S rRNA (uracil1939-C5)-methyltransferase
VAVPVSRQLAVGDEGISFNPVVGREHRATLSVRVAGETYFCNATTFFQVNRLLLESLITAALGDAAGEGALDLYCGVGLFTLPLARRYRRVVAVEANREAARFARRNLREAKLSHASVTAAPVGDWLRGGTSPAGPFEFVLLDPPRSGCEPQVTTGILSLRPGRIVYVSCDPATLARDLRDFVGGGYALDSVAAFDMFPQTHHVETVVRLSLAEPAPAP